MGDRLQVSLNKNILLGALLFTLCFDPTAYGLDPQKGQLTVGEIEDRKSIEIGNRGVR